MLDRSILDNWHQRNTGTKIEVNSGSCRGYHKTSQQLKIMLPQKEQYYQHRVRSISFNGKVTRNNRDYYITRPRQSSKS